MDKLLAEQVQFVDVPDAVEKAVQAKYNSKINAAGLERALQRAQRVRAVADSTRRATQPSSAVPMPGGPPRPAPATPGTPAPGGAAPAPRP